MRFPLVTVWMLLCGLAPGAAAQSPTLAAVAETPLYAEWNGTIATRATGPIAGQAIVSVPQAPPPGTRATFTTIATIDSATYVGNEWMQLRAPGAGRPGDSGRSGTHRVRVDLSIPAPRMGVLWYFVSVSGRVPAPGTVSGFARVDLGADGILELDQVVGFGASTIYREVPMTLDPAGFPVIVETSILGSRGADGLAGMRGVQVEVRVGFTLPTAFFDPLFGSGCPGSGGLSLLRAVNGDRPLLGQRFDAEVVNLTTTGMPILVLGFDDTLWGSLPLPFDLGLFGLPGCTLYTNVEYWELLSVAGQRASWNVQIPLEVALVNARFYLQVGVPDLGFNPAGMVVSNAGRAQVGVR